MSKELCEAPVLGMPTEKGIYVTDTDASVVAISGILHQDQELNGRTVLRTIAYESKVLSDTEMKYGLVISVFQRLMAHALIGVTKKSGNLVMC